MIEQQEALRDGLALLLERRGFPVLGCAPTAAGGETVISERHPDVAVVGLDLPDERGTELVRRLSSDRGKGTKFLIYTGLDDCDLLGAAFRCGAKGLVAKPASPAVLVEALREVWRGGRYFDSRFARADGEKGEGAAKALSGREAEMLSLLARGFSGEEIAQRFVLSPETVRTHVRNAMAKLDARTRTEAVVRALERGEIEWPELSRA